MLFPRRMHRRRRRRLSPSKPSRGGPEQPNPYARSPTRAFQRWPPHDSPGSLRLHPHPMPPSCSSRLCLLADPCALASVPRLRVRLCHILSSTRRRTITAAIRADPLAPRAPRPRQTAFSCHSIRMCSAAASRTSQLLLLRLPWPRLPDRKRLTPLLTVSASLLALQQQQLPLRCR